MHWISSFSGSTRRILSCWEMTISGTWMTRLKDDSDWLMAMPSYRIWCGWKARKGLWYGDGEWCLNQNQYMRTNQWRLPLACDSRLCHAYRAAKMIQDGSACSLSPDAWVFFCFSLPARSCVKGAALCTWGPKGGWTKARVQMSTGNMTGFWWDLDVLTTDCLETWQELSPWPSASNIFQHCFKMPPGGGIFEWKITVLDSKLPFPCPFWSKSNSSYRSLSWSACAATHQGLPNTSPAFLRLPTTYNRFVKWCISMYTNAIACRPM